MLCWCDRVNLDLKNKTIFYLLVQPLWLNSGNGKKFPSIFIHHPSSFIHHPIFKPSHLTLFCWQVFPRCCLNPELVAWIRLFLQKRSVSSSPSTQCLWWRFWPWPCQAGYTCCSRNPGTPFVSAGTTCLSLVSGTAEVYHEVVVFFFVNIILSSALHSLIFMSAEEKVVKDQLQNPS